MSVKRTLAEDPEDGWGSNSVEARAFLRTIVAFRHGDDFGVGEALNISANGIFIATEQIVPIGSLVDLKLSLPEETTTRFILVRGEVERHQSDPQKPRVPLGMGIRFLNLSVDAQEAIRRYVSARSVRAFYPSYPPPTLPEPVGGEARGRFELLSLLGFGATSEVYKAIDRELDEVVALKVLKTEFAGEREWVERLRRETRLTRRIRNEHVARIFDFGVMGGRALIAMEYIPGSSLTRALGDEGRLSEREALRIGTQVLEGVAAAHKLGIVHRDIKPSNIMITPAGKAIVLDFGLARADDDPRITKAGQTLGTPSYMAPEQFSGIEPTAASDIYAFGCILYEALTGQVPFTSNTLLGLATAHSRQEAAPVRSLAPGVSPFLESVVARCLVKDPKARYADASVLLEALGKARTGRAAEAPSSRPRRRVLIADAERDSAATLRDLLTDAGYDVTCVGDGFHLVGLALEKDADLIVTNVVLPNIDGFEACQILRSLPKTSQVPIVLTSNRGADKGLTGFVQRSFYMKKPFAGADLRQCLRELGLPLEAETSLA